MRKLITGSALFAALVVAGAAHAQEHPWIPSGFNGPSGSLPNGAPSVSDHPWVPSGVYVGNLPNGAPVFAPAAVPANAQASKRHTTTTR